MTSIVMGPGGGRAAERSDRMIACASHHRPRVVRRKDRPPDMVGPHEEKLPAFDHAHGLPRRPDVVADQRGCACRRVEAGLKQYSAIRWPAASCTAWICPPEGRSRRTTCWPAALSGEYPICKLFF